MRCLLAVLILLPWLSQAATFYVRLNGNDSTGDGSTGNPWRTLAKANATIAAGDTVIIGNGDFAESTQVAKSNIIWRAETNRLAITRAVRLDAPGNTLDGIRTRFTCDASNLTWGAAVYIRPEASYTVLTNCFFSDIPWVVSSNWFFNPTNNTISAPDVDLLAAGFTNGCRIYWGGVSYTNGVPGGEWKYANLGLSGVATNVTTTTFTLVPGVLITETNVDTFAIIQAGSSPYTMNSVKFITESGATSYPSNCVITSCLFSNQFGIPVLFGGVGHVLTNCEFAMTRGNSVIEWTGGNLLIVSNFIHDAPAMVYYSAFEHNAGWVAHGGGNFYDYIHAFLTRSSQNTAISSNVIFRGNWFQNIEQPIVTFGRLSSNSHTIKMEGNVFVGISGHMDSGEDNLSIRSNTFYRCAFEDRFRYIGVMGGSSPLITNFFFTDNLMASCGNHEHYTNEGYIQISNTNNPAVITNNFLTGLEIASWNAMTDFPAPWGINGGDPQFINEWNPLGPDGRPFTADDGLKLRYGSPATGIGALAVAIASTNLPQAFFTPSVMIASNYYDLKGSNYDTAWQGQLAFIRTNWARPWYTADPWTNVPQRCTFHATNSISGTMSTNTTNGWIGMDWFGWSFGDGSSNIVTRHPDVTHHFVITGQTLVTLTVTNSSGGVAQYSKKFRVLPGTNYANDIFYVSDDGSDANTGAIDSPWRTVTNGIQNMTAGDVLIVRGINHSNEVVDLNLVAGAVNGTVANPIKIISVGARLKALSQRRDNWYWEGFEFVAMGEITNAPGFPAVVNLPSPVVTNVAFHNFHFHHSPTGVSFANSPISGSAIYNRQIYFTNCNVFETEGQVFLINLSNSIVDSCIVRRIAGEGDFMAGNAVGIQFSRNYVEDIGYVRNNHSDVFQGAFGAGLNRDWIIRNNWLRTTDTNIAAQITSMGDSAYPHDGSYSNVQFFNNVCIGFYGGLAPIGLDGPKIWNNLFAYCGHGTSHAIVHGGSGGGLHGIDVRNNIFFGCGQSGVDTNKGWYSNGTQAESTNSTFAFADYNYVAGSNFTAKAVAPPDDLLHWAVTGQEVNGVNGGDPKFTDSANYDFRLLSTSPLINAGVVLSGFTTDFWGRERGATWDIGPFESESEAAVAGTNRITTRLR